MARIFIRLLMALAAATGCLSAHAASDGGPITIIAPYTPGAIVDTTARILAQQLQKQLNRTVIVENVPGASGAIGTDKVVRSIPDGRTLLLMGNGIAYRHLIFKVPYDPVRQLQPVSQIVTSPVVWVVHPSVPVHNIPELLAYAKTHAFSVGNSGAGGQTHLLAELFGLTAGIPLTHVPYRGDSAAIADALAGNVNSSVSSLAATQEFITAGRLRPIAVFDPARTPSLPSVETVAEAGYPKASGNVWVALLAPSGVPKQTIERLSKAVSASCANPDTRRKLEATGSNAVCGLPQEMGQVLHDDAERVQALIDSGRLKLEQ